MYRFCRDTITTVAHYNFLVCMYSSTMSSGGYDAANVADNARSGSDNYCYGCGNVDTNGYYITTVKLDTGNVSIKGLGKDEVLEGIIAYDRAERNGAYIDQINMITLLAAQGT